MHRRKDSVVCSAESKPEANIEWLLDGERIQGREVSENEGKSELRLVDTKISGILTCRAENSLGVEEIHFIVEGEQLK